MRKNILKLIQAHAFACYPRESCGLIIAIGRKERYIPCTNKAPDNEHFLIGGEDYANAEDQGTIIAVVHSHPDDTDYPSTADRISCNASGLPWHIISVNKDGAAATVRTLEPKVTPLIGREFDHGRQDCYTLVRDFYKRVLNIDLKNYARSDEWWNHGQNLYLDNFEDAGFYIIDPKAPLQFGDMILMQIQSDVPNHAGVFIGGVDTLDGKPIYPEPNGFIHHMFGQLSEHRVYGGYWAKHTTHILRHNEAPTC